MANKIFSIFLHAGRAKRKKERLGMICHRYKYLSFLANFFKSSVAQLVERETSNQKISGTKPGVI